MRTELRRMPGVQGTCLENYNFRTELSSNKNKFNQWEKSLKSQLAVYS